MEDTEVLQCKEDGCGFRCIRDGTMARHKIQHVKQVVRWILV
jgi:hypothetical protein